MSRLVFFFVCLANFSLLVTAEKKNDGTQSGNRVETDDNSTDIYSNNSTEIPVRGPDLESFANFDVYKTTNIKLSLEIETPRMIQPGTNIRSFRMLGSVNIHYERQLERSYYSEAPLFLDTLGLDIKQVKVSYDGGLTKSRVNFRQHPQYPDIPTNQTNGTDAECTDPDDPTGLNYRGTQNRTSPRGDGVVCQPWSSQIPNDHRYIPERYPDYGLGDHNYCRNPSRAEKLWCYNRHGREPRWQWCDTPPCSRRRTPDSSSEALEIMLDSNEPRGIVMIQYVVGPRSAAHLANTTLRFAANSYYPVLATFNQPNMARSWIPCQDSIHVKSPVEMMVSVPQPFTALMSGIFVSQRDVGDRTIFKYHQPAPVAAQHLTLTMGHFGNKTLSERITVWFELLDSALPGYEREEVELGLIDAESLLKICEGMVGPYVWEKLNIVLLPDQLGYNGQRLGPNTIYIPVTLVRYSVDSPIDDRSLLIQELTRQMFLTWFGDLVTPSHRDGWLSEGIAEYLSYYATAKAMDNDIHISDFLFKYALLQDVEKNRESNLVAIRGALRLKHIEERVIGGKSSLIGFLRLFILINTYDSVSKGDFVELFGLVFPDIEIDWDDRLWGKDQVHLSSMVEFDEEPVRYEDDVMQIFSNWTQIEPVIKGSQLKLLKAVQLAYLLDYMKLFNGLDEDQARPLTRKITSALKKIGIYSDQYMFPRWAQSALTLGDEDIVRDSLKYVATFQRNPAALAIFDILSWEAEQNDDDALKKKLKKVAKKVKDSSFLKFNRYS